jgi:hypothetical protein
VILLFPSGAVRWDAALRAGSATRLGAPLGSVTGGQTPIPDGAG